MVAVPYRAELRAEAVRGTLGLLTAYAVALAMFAAAGRLGDLNVGPSDALLIVAAVLVMTAIYSLPPSKMTKRLARLPPLDPDASRAAPTPPRRWPLWAIGGGLLLGGIALVLDLELDLLAIFFAIGLGSNAGGPAYEAWRVARHEREHGGTVYRVEDPPGTDAGLAWLPRGGQ
jgi:hypothetical protein